MVPLIESKSCFDKSSHASKVFIDNRFVFQLKLIPPIYKIIPITNNISVSCIRIVCIHR